VCIQRTLAAVERYLAVRADDDVTMIEDVFGKRYGEVLLVRIADSGPEATVTTPSLIDCPAGWGRSMHRRSPRQRAAAALLNGLATG
jgi:hypothetical protein